MLFSEPKIPQLAVVDVEIWQADKFQCSSASRKFLNRRDHAADTLLRKFQCSSASRKFLNEEMRFAVDRARAGFSALQRAENSSMLLCRTTNTPRSPFQCSSASRKFLNTIRATQRGRFASCFSALQRAENSSIRSIRTLPRHSRRRFQCSSASRKFLNGG